MTENDSESVIVPSNLIFNYASNNPLFDYYQVVEDFDFMETEFEDCEERCFKYDYNYYVNYYDMENNEFLDNYNEDIESTPNDNEVNERTSLVEDDDVIFFGVLEGDEEMRNENNNNYHHVVFNDKTLLELYLDNQDVEMIDYNDNDHHDNEEGKEEGEGIFECDICVQQCQSSDSYQCENQHQFCSECMKTYIEVTKISRGECNITCPFRGCSTVLNDNEIKARVSTRLYIRYLQLVLVQDELKMDLILNKHNKDNATTSSRNEKEAPQPCPNLCGKMLIRRQLRNNRRRNVNNNNNNNNNNPHYYCSKCDVAFCFSCKKKCHPKLSCLEYATKSSEFEIKWKLEMNIRECPQCKIPIEKNEGCNHMKCESCGTDFCWLCNQKNMFFSHFNDINSNCYGKGFYNPTEEELFAMWHSFRNPQIIKTSSFEHPRHTSKIAKVGKFGLYAIGISAGAVILGVASPLIIVGGAVYGVYYVGKKIKRRRRRSLEYVPLLYEYD